MATEGLAWQNALLRAAVTPHRSNGITAEKKLKLMQEAQIRLTALLI